jgi:DnaJ-class molecular chaperone
MPESKPKNLYKVLGVHSTATADEIKTAYRILVKKHHPDRPENRDRPTDKISAINAAYEILSDSRKRFAYDAELLFQAQQQAAAKAARRPAREKRPERIIRNRKVPTWESYLYQAAERYSRTFAKTLIDELLGKGKQ